MNQPCCCVGVVENLPEVSCFTPITIDACKAPLAPYHNHTISTSFSQAAVSQEITVCAHNNIFFSQVRMIFLWWAKLLWIVWWEGFQVAWWIMLGHYDPVNVSNLNDSLINVSLSWEVYYFYHLLFSGNTHAVLWPSRLLLLLLYFRHYRYTIKKIPWTPEKVLICVTQDFIALSWLSILVALEINVRTKPLRSWLVLPPPYLIKKSPTVILRAINPTLLSLIIRFYSYYSTCDGYQIIPLAQFELWDCFRHYGPFTYYIWSCSYCKFTW